MSKTCLYLLLLITCLGMALRIYNLGNKSVWQTEGSGVYYAEVLIPSIVKKLANGQYENSQQPIQEWRDGEPSHPPLYYIILHFWLNIGRDEVTIRLLSALVGVLSIPLLYLLSKALFNEKIALLSALLLAVSPLHIAHSQNIRMYTILTFLVLLSTYCMVGFLKTKAGGWRIGYVLSAALGLYIHYIIVFALAFQNVIMLLFVWQQKDKRRLLIWLVMQVCVLLLFAPWVSFALFQTAESMGESQNFGSIPFNLPIRLFRTFSLGDSDLPSWMTGVGLITFFILILYGIFAPETNDTAREKYWRWITPEVVFCLIYLFFAALGALVVYSVRPGIIRFALFGLPAYHMLVARGIERIRIGDKVKLTVVAMLITFSFFAIVTGIYQAAPLEDWRGATNYVLSKSQPRDIVVFHAFYAHRPFDYYAMDQIPTYIGLRKDNIQPRNLPGVLQEATQGHKRMWLVLSRVRYVDPEWKVKKYIDTHYRMLEEEHYIGVDIFLYEL